MIRYYFDIRDSSGLFCDEEGIEFRTQREAEVEATRSLADLAKDLAITEERQDCAVEVRTVVGEVFQAALVFQKNSTRH